MTWLKRLLSRFTYKRGWMDGYMAAEGYYYNRILELEGRDK